MRQFAADTGGTTAIEYALLGSLIAVVLVTALTSMGTSVNNMIAAVAPALR